VDRRGFIQSFIGAAALAMVPEGRKPPIMLHDAAHHELSGGLGISPYLHDGKGHDIGFGLAQAKQEGASIPYDPGVRLFSAEHPKALKEGLSKMFGEVYEDLDPDNLEKLWIEVDDEDKEV
jgi:hypothetical protein